jgi:hypothetical protein
MFFGQRSPCHDPRAVGTFVEKLVQTAQQAVAQRQVRRVGVDHGRPERFQTPDRIPDVGQEIGHPHVFPVHPGLRQERMLREADMQLGDHVDRRCYPAPLGGDRVQRPVSEVFIDVPDGLTAPLGRDAEQGRAPVTQADGAQPARRDEPVALGPWQIQALDDKRTRLVGDLERQAVDVARLLQGLLAREPPCHPGSVQHLLEYAPELRQTRLTAVPQRVSQPLDHGETPFRSGS